MRRILGCLLLAVAALAAETPQELFEKGLVKERSEGNLKEAIRLYERTAETAGKNRGLAAKALLEAGECYRKLGDAEARKLFERVIRDYADQKEAAVLARARLGKEPPISASGMSFRQVWRLPAKAEVYSSISREGRYLAYTDWAQHGDLFLHDFVTSVDRRLTNTGTDGMAGPHIDEFAEEFTFSPDGRQLAYSWYRDDRERYELRVIDLKSDGIPHPRLLFDNPEVEWIAPYDWSPDGKWIAANVKRTDNTAQIGLISAADGSLRVLKSIDWRGATNLFFSPDGKYLGYDLPESDTSQQRDVFVIALDGTREIPAVVHRGQDLMIGWSPDNKRLLFASDRSGSMDLWAVAFGGGKIEGEPEVVKADIGAASQPGLTRSGALYLRMPTGAEQPAKIQMASFDLNTGKLLSALSNVGQEYFESDRLPTWSPDGKYLAYLSQRGRAGSSNEVMVIQSVEDPREVRALRVKLSDIYSNVWGNAWAPGGQSILLQGRDSKGRWGVYRMDSRTGDVTLLISDQRREILYPTWSTDGKRLYFSRRISGGKEYALIQRDLANGQEKEVIRRPFVAVDAVSPDGRYLAPSTTDPSSGSRIKLLIPIAGGEPRELMRVSAQVEPADLTRYLKKGVALFGAQWAPGGRSFFTMKRFNGENGRMEIWRIPIDGGSPVKLDLALDVKHWLSLSPDGRRIVLFDFPQPPARGQEIWALENFLPTLTASK